MSLLTRSADIRVAAGAGRTIHCVESVSRIAAGAVEAILACLAVQANLLLGELSAVGGLPLLHLVSVVAGASERLVPSLIARFESTAMTIASSVPASLPGHAARIRTAG